MNPKIRILLVDDHFVVCTGLTSSLNSASDMRVVAEAEDGVSAIEEFERHRPDVVVMDMRLPNLDGVEATRAICAKFPGAKIVALSSHEGDEDIHRALAAGAKAYLSKRVLRAELLTAIRAAQAGQRYLPPDIAARLAEHLPRVELSARELEVLRLVARGHINKEIGDQLAITEGGSSLFSVESELGEAEFAGDEIEHGGQVSGGTIAARFAFGGAEHAVESFHEGIGHAPFPVRQYSRQMFLHHLSHLDHRAQNVLGLFSRHPPHPPTPHSKPVSRHRRRRTLVDVL